MNISRQEEIISALWIIAAILCFNGGHPVFGWGLLVKGILDSACAVVFALIEIKRLKDEG